MIFFLSYKLLLQRKIKFTNQNIFVWIVRFPLKKYIFYSCQTNTQYLRRFVRLTQSNRRKVLDESHEMVGASLFPSASLPESLDWREKGKYSLRFSVFPPPKIHQQCTIIKIICIKDSHCQLIIKSLAVHATLIA